MKTLVMVSIPGAVLSLDLSEFPGSGPCEGRVYEFDGKLYKVLEVIETLGSCAQSGKKITAEMRLLQFAEAVCRGDEELKQQIMKPRKIGKDAGEDLRSPGGIIIASQESKPGLGFDFEQLIFVKTVPVESKSEARLPRPLRLVAETAGETLEAAVEADESSAL